MGASNVTLYHCAPAPGVGQVAATLVRLLDSVECREIASGATIELPVRSKVVFHTAGAGRTACLAVQRLRRAGASVLGVLCPQAAKDRAIVQGCRDFVVWPCRLDELELRLGRIGLAVRRWAAAPKEAQEVCEEELAHLNFLGRSQAFRESLRLIKRFATCDAPVLLQGETGTGKELAARALHYLGERRTGPFVPLNCGAIPDTLLESELFGHLPGAFTDARTGRKGVVALADGGTLLLDEIDSLSPKGQVSLLRFLQDRTYRPVGGGRLYESGTRVVASTNQDLHRMARTGLFRQDLLFRLNVTAVTLPPLRERRDDISLLTRHFLERLSARYDRPLVEPDDTALLRLNTHDWPGNVRELESVLHRAFLLSDGPQLTIDPGAFAAAGLTDAGPAALSLRPGATGPRSAPVRPTSSLWPTTPVPPTRRARRTLSGRQPRVLAEAAEDAVVEGVSPEGEAAACASTWRDGGPCGREALATDGEGFRAARARVVSRFEREYLIQLMIETGGNVSEAARRAGKERRAMGRLLQRHGIRRGLDLG